MWLARGKAVWSLLALLLSTCMAALFGLAGPASAAVGDIVRVSVTKAGGQAAGASTWPGVSGDGRFVVFQSTAANLVPKDTNGSTDIFVHDVRGRTTSRVSLTSKGGQANGESLWASVSSDGRFVAFQSFADNLVPGDTNGVADVFLRDREKGRTVLVSVGMAGAKANGYSQTWLNAVSANGRYVAFWSAASNLVPGDTNSALDVFVRDMWNRTTVRASVSSGGQEGDRDSDSPSISPDGRYVGFQSFAGNLAAGDANGIRDAYLRDLWGGTTEQVSVNSQEEQPLDQTQGGWVSVSNGGRFVSFESNATNLAPGANDGRGYVYVRDRTAGTTSLVGLGDSSRISADGRFLTHRAGVWYEGELEIAFVDLTSGATTIISQPYGDEADGFSDVPSISASGHYVAFESSDSNPALVPEDTNGSSDVFLVQTRELLPAAKSECLAGGWRTFPQFANQSACVSAVRRS